MRFEDFIGKGQVKKGASDYMLSDSLIKCAKKDLSYLETLSINEDSARKVMISYYDTLRSVLEAIAAREGYKFYSHEAYAFYLQTKYESTLSLKFDRLRKIRNKLSYYGENISPEEVKEYKEEIKKMIKKIMELFPK